MITLFASRWSLRQRDVRAANSDSKSWTFVVTMSGSVEVLRRQSRAFGLSFGIIGRKVAVMLQNLGR